LAVRALSGVTQSNGAIMRAALAIGLVLGVWIGYIAGTSRRAREIQARDQVIETLIYRAQSRPALQFREVRAP
jgi:hypothetical protein